MKIENCVNILISTIIGVTSGVCFSLLISSYTAYLTLHNVSLEMLGFLSLRTIPYSMKFLWAPFVDSHHIKFFIPSFGHRKSWIITMQCCLVVAIMLMAFIDIEKHLYIGFALALVTSFLAATHDIAIDAFRIEFSKARKFTAANSFVILGFRIGFLISGALALYLSTVIGWKYVFIFIASSIIPCIFVIFFIKEDKIHEHRVYQSKKVWVQENVIEPMRILFTLPKFYLILFVVAFYKMSDGYLSTLLITFLLQSEFSLIEISIVTETFGLACFIIGSFIGGWFVRKGVSSKNLFVAEIMAALTNLIFILLLHNHGNMTLYIITTFFESLSAGIASILLISYMSSLCMHEKHISTHYAFLISLSGLSRAIVASTSGLLVTNCGWSMFFIISALLSVPSLICLIILSKYKAKH